MGHAFASALTFVLVFNTEEWVEFATRLIVKQI